MIAARDRVAEYKAQSNVSSTAGAAAVLCALREEDCSAFLKAIRKVWEKPLFLQERENKIFSLGTQLSTTSVLPAHSLPSLLLTNKLIDF